MAKEDRFIDILKKILPYLVILIFSIAPLIIYLRPGIPTGDDQIWNLSYMGDVYYSVKDGLIGIQPSHLISGYSSVFIYLFYGCFPEYLTVYLTLMFEWTGIGLVSMLKIVSILSVFVSSIFVYLLTMKISGSKKVALGIALIWSFFPYRINDFLYRAAFSEAFAIGLIPILIYGVYRILNDDKPRVSSYICTIFGAVSLVLSHPFTALMGGGLAFLLILCSPLQLAKVMKTKRTYIYLIPSLVLIGMMLVFYIVPMLSAMNSGIYRISDPVVMWKNPEHLKNDMWKNFPFSGILSYDWIRQVINDYGWKNMRDTVDRWQIELFLFGFSLIASVVADYFITKEKFVILKKWKNIIILGIVFIPSIIYLSRIEIFIALSVYFVIYLFEDYGEKEEPCSIKPLEYSLGGPLLSSVICLAFGIVMLNIEEVYDIVPEVLLNAQFPFRFFIPVGIAVILGLAYLSKLAKGRKHVVLFIGMLAATMCAIGQGQVDKRIAIANGGNKIYYLVDREYVSSMRYVGWNNEYVPINMYDYSYVPDYSNSLYYKVATMCRSYTWYHEGNYIEPVVLDGTGEGTSSNYVFNTPSLSFDLNVTSINGEAAKIQLAQFYYDGYEVRITNKTSGESYVVKASNVDNLLAFDVKNTGNFQIELYFAGSIGYKVGRPLFYVGVAGTVALGALGIFFNIKDKKKEEAEN